MSWLGQKPDPEPTRPSPPATGVVPPRSPDPIPQQRVETTERFKVASIGKSLHIKGELTGSEDVVIEGKVEGTIALNGFHVTITETGRVAAEIHAKSVVLGGVVKGNITAHERVEIDATGTMLGDVYAPRVVLVDGARFKGNIDMDAKPGSAAASASAKTKATGDAPVSRDEAQSFASSTKR